jgi:hypothetical protein
MPSEPTLAGYPVQFTPIGPTSDRESSLTDLPAGEDYVEFYVAYGECFAAWSGVEQNLLSVYVFLMNSSDYASTSASYYSTTGFRAKLEMVTAVVKTASRASQDDRKKWQSLFEGASKKSRRRNELAHNAVFFGRLAEIGTKKMFLGDPQGPGEGSRLHAHDLREIRQSFTALGEEIFSFWLELLNRVPKA